MKQVLLLIFILGSVAVKAQKIDSIYVNLYTDSLKKDTYNYINVDGLLSDGSYLPLDSSHLIFKASAGRFVGNSLWVEKDIKAEKITISVTSRKNASLNKVFVMYIKKQPDPELPTEEDILNGMKQKAKKNKG